MPEDSHGGLSPARPCCLSGAHGLPRLQPPRRIARARGVHACRADAQTFWALASATSSSPIGLGGIGKFERYFRILQRYLLPAVHSPRNGRRVARFPLARLDRERFMRERWNTWRWRLLLNAFFSRFAMGRLGRDPAFFDHVEGSVAAMWRGALCTPAVDLDPAANPYLHWIMKGTHGAALPLAWRAEHFDTIRSRLDRLDIRQGSLEAFVSTGEKADGFNFSDIFEYMSQGDIRGGLCEPRRRGQSAGAARLLEHDGGAAPDARRLRWRVRALADAEKRGKAIDKAFFYADFVVEEVLA